ncbi:Nst1p [Saccharomyces paradoxus]|uniref:Stress response protein NST1 n=1 Tax=Saccharomyces paradoxus TaxID=27291 RepID=A0A8B8UYL1_SACPA|nr:Nst1 [Saccharomyces paradoxus]QHS75818.1 Nst1 [Saccharomyces paradoxus]
MPPNSKSKRRKNKSKQHNKKNGNLDPEQNINPTQLVPRMEPELYHTESDYPTSRVIKRAPNGDVIVESINTDDDKKKRTANLSHTKDDMDSASTLAFTLDSHWESLSPEEKKTILRIEKEEVFNVIRNYQDDHSCSCSVCGRRHLAMDQEMERIYNTLYAMDKDKDPETNPVKFHLGIIKELQISKNQQQNDFSPTKGEAGKDFLSSSTVGSLKEEVLHFKQKQLSKQEPTHNETADNTSLLEENLNNIHINETPRAISTSFDSVSDEELKQKYSNFTKTFISSHPKIAQEYVQKMMMYPNIRALTDDLINSNGQGFLNAIEDFVRDDQRPTSKIDDSTTEDKASYADLTDPKEFTTMLHSGKPLTENEYSDLQRNIAERMTNAYDTTSKQFKDVSQLEKELFTRFMSGKDKKSFRELIIQSFRKKFDGELGPSVLAATLSSCFSSQSKDNSLDTDSIYEDEDEEDYDDYSEYAEDSEEASEYEGVEAVKKLAQYDEKNDEVRDILHLSHDHDRKRENHPHHHYHSVSTHSEDELSEEECVSDIELPHDPHQHYHHDDGILDEDEDDLEEGDENEEDDEDDTYDSGLDETDRLEEGRKLIQIAITKLLQSRIMASYHEKQADNNRLKLLQELEEEKRKKREKEEKKQKKREKEKEKKRLQQLAKEEEKRKREEEKERLKKELEEREMKRREAQRKKVEEAKRKKDEERKRRLEEQQRREEMQEKQRKQKEELKRKREEEKKRIREQKKIEQEKLQKEKEEEEKQRLIAEDALRKQKLSEEQVPADIRSTKPLTENGVCNSVASQLHPDMISYQEDNGRSINDEILKMVSSVAASKPVSPTGFNIHDLLLPSSDNQIATMEQSHLSHPGNQNSHFGSATIPNALDLSAKSSSQAENNYLMNSQTLENTSLLVPNGSSPTKLLPNAFGLSSWDGLTNTLSNNPTCKPPIIQTTRMESEAQKSSPQPAIPSFGLPNDGTHRKSFTDELNSLTSMLSSAGFADTSLSSSGFPPSQRSVWNDQRSSFSGPTTAGNFNNSSIQGGVLLPPTLGSVESFPNRTSIWDNSSTPMISKSELAGRSITGTVQDTPTFMTSNIWSSNSQYSSPYLASNALQLPGISSGVDESHILDSIYNAYLVISPQDSLNQYVAIGRLFQNVVGLNLDYSTFINKLISMQATYNCEFFTDSNGSITHVRFMRESPTGHSKGLLNQLFNGMNDPTTTSFTSRPHTSAAATFPIASSTTQTT